MSKHPAYLLIPFVLLFHNRPVRSDTTSSTLLVIEPEREPESEHEPELELELKSEHEPELELEPAPDYVITTSQCYDGNRGKCDCNEIWIDCELYGNAGSVYYYNHVAKSIFEIACTGESSDINSLLEHVPSVNLYDETTFKLYNCSSIPDMLRRENIIYDAHIAFETLIPPEFFWKSHNIQRLAITYGNVFNTLPSELFRKLDKLKYLLIHIVGCGVGNIKLPTGIFDSLANLQSLKLAVIQQRFEYPCFMELTSEHFRNLSALRSLDLAANHLITLHVDIFSTLAQLNYLNLSRNELHELPPKLLVAQRKLLVLDLSSNLLEYLPAGLFDATHILWQLILANNYLSNPSNIIGGIKPLHYLYRLDLGYNDLASLTGAGHFGNDTLLSSFVHTDGSSLLELIENLDFIFNLPQMEKQDRRHNLTLINLSHNQITQFDMDWTSASYITCPFKLDLSHNNISQVYALSPHIFKGHAGCKESIKLTHNPLKCDCKLAWIFKSEYLSDRDELQCVATNPSNQNGYSLTPPPAAALCIWQPAFCPTACVCVRHTAMLHINCAAAKMQEIARLPRPEEFALNYSTLVISYNEFRELPANTSFGYGNVTQLNASHNQITTLLPSRLPPNLTVLDVRYNRLARLSDPFLLAYLNESESLQQLYLAGNPWQCDCGAEQMLRAVRIHRTRICDVENLRCANRRNATLLNVVFADICKTGAPAPSTSLISIRSNVALAVIVLLALIAVYYKYKLQIHVWLYSHKLCLCCINECELDKDKAFDAFISYAHRDEHFVNHTLLPQLEQGDPQFRVCTHEHNWLAGAYIPEQIIESVAQSCRTIIVLSQHFMESDWGRMEFRTAHQYSLDEGRARIIIIKYGEISNSDLLDRELKAYLDMNTYLDWQDAWFWQKLRYAMPHKKGEVGNAGMLELKKRVYVMGQVEMNQLRGGRN
ncbi:protein toll-like [Anastrepha ludens]|uniref:protein toll-like n=1 Tax=Anastrepha ludens TaxID=28586 RepID=UPI0023AFACB5|nr:protein toll-like [Anastrepha ludens]